MSCSSINLFCKAYSTLDYIRIYSSFINLSQIIAFYLVQNYIIALVIIYQPAHQAQPAPPQPYQAHQAQPVTVGVEVQVNVHEYSINKKPHHHHQPQPATLELQVHALQTFPQKLKVVELNIKFHFICNKTAHHQAHQFHHVAQVNPAHHHPQHQGQTFSILL